MRFSSLSAAAGVLIAWAPVLPARSRAVTAVHRDGQTFVTWRECEKLGCATVYRCPSPSGRHELDAADYLGEVDDKSSHNAERSKVEHGERT